MNDHNKPESHFDNTGVEIPALSSKPKKLFLGVLLGVFIAYLLVSIFWDKSKKESHKDANEVNVTNDMNFYPAPKIQSDIGKKENNVNSEQSNLDNKKKADPEEKLLMLRQHAPIQMFLRESNKNPLLQKTESENQTVSNGSQMNIQQDQETNSTINDNHNTESNAANNTSSHITNDKNGQVMRLKHRDYLLLEGTIIPGVLQTALHSDLSGNLKAQVSEDVYASCGRRILIPKGSQLLGHYAGNTSQQQSRIFVVWTRIIRPDGISVQLQAEGTDEIGQAGLTGDVNHHYIARFGQASLLSLIGAGVAGSSVSSNQNYTFALANSFATTSQQSLQDAMHINPTITIKAGLPVAVYVNQDISFYGKVK